MVPRFGVIAAWSVQGLQFTSTLKIFPLTTFDMILGMDWLEQYSPMKIHWLEKMDPVSLCV
jgi:hypothetical protein